MGFWQRRDFIGKEEIIIKIINFLTSKKSTGHDETTTTLINKCANEEATPLKYIFNTHFIMAVFQKI